MNSYDKVRALEQNAFNYHILIFEENRKYICVCVNVCIENKEGKNEKKMFRSELQFFAQSTCLLQQPQALSSGCGY